MSIPKKTDLKELELMFRDVLLLLMFDVPSVVDWSNLISVEAGSDSLYTSGIRHNYQREKLEYNGVHRIDYKGRKLAVVQRRPHKKVSVYPFYDSDRMAQKIFERVVTTYIPQAKMVTEHSE